MAKEPKETVQQAPVVFIDQKFKSRVIVLKDNRTFAVEKGRIATVCAELIAMLDKHPEFKRLSSDEA